MNRDIPPDLKPNERIAEGRGICGQCTGPINQGELFRWSSAKNPYPTCCRCIEKAKQQGQQERQATEAMRR